MSISLFYSSTTLLNTKTFLPYHSSPSTISCKISNKNKHHNINKKNKNDANNTFHFFEKTFTLKQEVGTTILNEGSNIRLDRRNILIGLGTLCGATTIMQNPNLNTSLASEVLPRKLDSTIRTQVPRGQKSRTKKQKEELEEVLNVNLELLKTDEYIKFDVFINEEDDNPSKMKLMNSEYAGSFVSLPHASKAGKRQKTSLKLGLTDLIQDLGVDDDDSVEVLLVPRAGSGEVVITDMKIDYIS